jgi:TatD DNase family protein
MIDVHCHLEAKDYDSDRDQVIEKCRKELKAVITSCTHPRDFQLTMKLVENFKGFVFASVGFHPEYVKEAREKEIDDYIELIKENKDKIVSIGEVGLDKFWIKESEWQEKQKEIFKKFIDFAKEIKKPLTIHSRDAYEDAVKILEQEDAKKVHLHLFGDNKLVKRVAENNWYISIGPIVLRSKKHFQIVRDMPLELLLLETDSPWNHPKVFTEHIALRNDPTSVKVVAERIAEIKKISLEEVAKITTENAIKLFELPL